MRNVTEGGKHRKQHVTIVSSDEPATVVVSTDSGHWFRLFRAVVRSGIWARLTPSGAKVLVVLAEHVNDGIRRERGEWLAWPSISTIMAAAGLHRRVIFTAITELEKAGLLRRRSNGGGHSSTMYQLVEPVHGYAPPPCTGVHPPRAQACTRLRMNERDRPTTGDVVVEMLVGQGFDAGDAGRIAASTDADQVKIAIANADHVEHQGKLRDRRGFIVKAIREKHSLLDGVKRRQAQASAQTRRRQHDDRARADAAAERARATAETRAIETTIAKLTDQDLQKHKAAVLADMDLVTRRLVESSDPRRSQVLKAAIYEKLRT